MKKLLVTILAIVYLATSTGATLHVHYCMGKFYSVDFVKKDDCSKCGMKANDGCCKDEFKVLKVSDNHKLISNDINLSPSIAALNTNNNLDEQVFFTDNTLSLTHNNSPPNSSGTPLFILNCVFRL